MVWIGIDFYKWFCKGQICGQHFLVRAKWSSLSLLIFYEISDLHFDDLFIWYFRENVFELEGPGCEGLFDSGSDRKQIWT